MNKWPHEQGEMLVNIVSTWSIWVWIMFVSPLFPSCNTCPLEWDLHIPHAWLLEGVQVQFWDSMNVKCHLLTNQCFPSQEGKSTMVISVWRLYLIHNESFVNMPMFGSRTRSTNCYIHVTIDKKHAAEQQRVSKRYKLDTLYTNMSIMSCEVCN